MALGLLAPSQGLVGELSQHLFIPLKNLITTMQAVFLKPVPTLQIRRSQHTFTWGQAVRSDLLCTGKASWILASYGGFYWSVSLKPLCYSKEAYKEEQRTADFTNFALFYIFQLFWKVCELKGWLSQTWCNYARLKLKWRKVVSGISVTQKVTCCFYCPFCRVSISVTLYREHLWNKKLWWGQAFLLGGYFPLQSISTSFLPPSFKMIGKLPIRWDITNQDKYIKAAMLPAVVLHDGKSLVKEHTPHPSKQSSCPFLFANQPLAKHNFVTHSFHPSELKDAV